MRRPSLSPPEAHFAGAATAAVSFSGALTTKVTDCVRGRQVRSSAVAVRAAARPWILPASSRDPPPGT